MRILLKYSALTLSSQKTLMVVTYHHRDESNELSLLMIKFFVIGGWNNDYNELNNVDVLLDTATVNL